MANRTHAYKHRDVVRIVRAARAAGVDVEAVTVDPHSGAITVGPAQGEAANRKFEENQAGKPARKPRPSP
jgi:hypothetical protein